MRGLIITDDIRARIKEAVARAEAHPIPLRVVRAGAIPGERTNEVLGADVKLTDRPPGFERPASEHVRIPMGYRMAISVEEQPAGFLRHLSVSVGRRGKVPSIEALHVIAELCGKTMAQGLAGGVRPRSSRREHSGAVQAARGTKDMKPFPLDYEIAKLCARHGMRRIYSHRHHHLIWRCR